MKTFRKKELEESQTALYYGYQSLLEEEQKIYRQFIKGLEEFSGGNFPVAGF